MVHVIRHPVSIYLFFLLNTGVIMTLLLYFVCCITYSFSYEDKRLALHWTTHNWRIHWPVAFTSQNTHVPKEDILNTWRKLARVEKQRNSIPREHLP